MAAFRISDLEWEALAGLPDRAFRLYLCLRRRMDFGSGMVGVRPRVSWQALAEDLYVEPAAGRTTGDSGSPSLKALRFAAELLQRAGLLESRSADRALIFALPLALAELRAVEVGQSRGRAGAEQVGQDESKDGQGFAEDSRQSSGRVNAGEVGQASGIWCQEERHSFPSSSQAPVSSGAVDKSREPIYQDDGTPANLAAWVNEMRHMGFADDVVGNAASVKVYQQWLRDQVSLADVLDARESKGGQQAETPKYLAAVVATRQMQFVAGPDGREVRMPAWACNWSTIVRRGERHGLTFEDGRDDPQAFKARLFALEGLTQGGVQ